MRVIDEAEIRIFNQISLGHGHIADILVEQIPDLVIEVDGRVNGTEINLLFPMGIDDKEMNAQALEQIEKIIYIINFIKYLEGEGFVITAQFSHARTGYGLIGKPERTKQFSEKNSKVQWMFPDKDVKNLITTYADRSILPTSKLRAFVNHGYRTKNDRRHRQIVVISWFAIVISLLLGIYAVFQDFRRDSPTSKQMDSVLTTIQNEKRPSREQMDSIVQVLNKIELENRTKKDSAQTKNKKH